MKSRFALTLVIATGMLMSTGGATLAVTGSSGSGSAAQAEYCVAGDTSDGCSENGENAGAVLGTSESNEPSGTVPSQDEQVATASTDSGSLPFTGFAAIPLLIIGLGFVSVGLMLRFRTNRDN